MKTFIKNLLMPHIKSKPDFIIAGAQKSGTTSLYRYLSEHPMVLPNKSWKEVHYYNNIENFRKGIGWYLNHFPNKHAKQNRLTFEATPEYLYFPEIPKRIYNDLGPIKIIVILRNPADRAYSAWHMYHSFKDNPLDHLRALADPRSFVEAIDEELFSGSYPSNHPHHYIDRGKYIFQINRYEEVFGKKNVLVLNFSDLKKNLAQLLDTVCTFLNIPQFQSEQVSAFEKKQYNVGTYQKDDTQNQKIMALEAFFAPYNKMLFDRIGETYHWNAR